MDFFDKAQQVARNVVSTVENKINGTPDQRELAGLKVQLETVNKKLNSYYAQIGKKYVDYITNCQTEETFNVDEILELMKTEAQLKAEIELRIAEKEKQMKAAVVESARIKAQEEFNKEQAKLDAALKMDVITIEEYTLKLAAAQKKLDNFDILRKLEIQYNMQIITKEEYEAKVKEIIG